MCCIGGEKRDVAVREPSGLEMAAGARSRLACGCGVSGQGHSVSELRQREYEQLVRAPANCYLPISRAHAQEASPFV
jgi:hypothetical protein